MNQRSRDLLLARQLVQSGAARAIREARGLSREELARACEPSVTAGAVRLWEAGERRPHGEKGAAYGAVLRELMAGEVTGVAG